MSQFVVLDRVSKKARYQTDNLEAANAYVAGSNRPCSVAMAIETVSRVEWMFRIEIIDGPSGRVLARSAEFEFSEVVDLFADAKLALVPACLSVETEGGVQ